MIFWFTMNRYVLNLALADTLFLITLPLRAYETTQNGIWFLPESLCKAKEVVLFLNYYSSVLFLGVSLSKMRVFLNNVFSIISFLKLLVKFCVRYDIFWNLVTQNIDHFLIIFIFYPFLFQLKIIVAYCSLDYEHRQIHCCLPPFFKASSETKKTV